MKNVIILRESEILPDAEYLGIYLYPDDTVEFIFSKNLPANSCRGLEIMKGMEKSAGVVVGGARRAELSMTQVCASFLMLACPPPKLRASAARSCWPRQRFG